MSEQSAQVDLDRVIVSGNLGNIMLATLFQDLMPALSIIFPISIDPTASI